MSMLTLALVLLTGVASETEAVQATVASVSIRSLDWVDRGRQREVPVVVYTGDAPSATRLRPAILSHGYGAKATDHGFIARYLATHGYYVVSIQHEIAGDAPLPTTGNPYETRMPSWRRGVENIRFVLDELKKTQPALDYGHVLLVGHSQGGDTSMLLAREHPTLVETVISLDNRRMPWPRAARPRLFSIRSSDQQADVGVIPTAEEQRRFGMQIVTLPATRHDDMWDGATAAQKAEIVGHIERFLRSVP